MAASLRSNFAQIRSGLQGKAGRVVAKTTHEIQAGAMERSRVDTGQMRAGWEAHVEGTHGDVTNDVDHTIYNEFGTVHMAAQPMAGPAAEEARPGFIQDMRRIVE